MTCRRSANYPGRRRHSACLQPHTRNPPPPTIRGAWSSVSGGTTASVATSTRAASAASTTRRSVITKNRYEDVYGTGLHLRFGGGLLLDEISEVRVDLHPAVARCRPDTDGRHRRRQPLRAVPTTIRASALDVGFGGTRTCRAASAPTARVRSAWGFVDETDLELVAPALNIGGTATDFYDRTTAFTLGWQRRRADAALRARRHLQPDRTSLGQRHVRGGRPGRHGAGDHQRRQRPLDAAIPGRGPRPLLNPVVGRRSGWIARPTAKEKGLRIVVLRPFERSRLERGEASDEAQRQTAGELNWFDTARSRRRSSPRRDRTTSRPRQT